jgi:hypothetical protein
MHRGVNQLILFPTLRYKLTADLDLDFVWQSFFAERTGWRQFRIQALFD